MAALLGCLLVAAGCSRPDGVHTLSGTTMGTVWTIKLAELPEGVTVDLLRADIDAELERIDAEMSTYRPDSALSRFNRAAAGERMKLPEGLAVVLGAALRLAEETGGAYDPTIGPLVNLWGFGPEGRRGQAPVPSQIAEAMARVGWQRLKLEGASVEQPGGVYVDLSSIAKGYAVDRVLDLLQRNAVRNCLVDIGGDLRVLGERPDGSPWRVAVERPVPGARGVQAALAVENVAVATSGNYRNFFADAGLAWSHTIDPRTGYPVQHHAVSVTVIHSNAMMADALSTALGVLPPNESLAFAQARGLAVLLLLREGDHVIERMSPAFARYLRAPDAGA
ncbi:MAG TPA: FAD:protein FMN transferase [Arenimonas sp.]|nr:FAD:protein FMN transferase [Arenimonas sp.]